MKIANRIVALTTLAMAQIAYAQSPSGGIAIGENTKLTASGVATFGYAGDYGDEIPSSHGLSFGFSGATSGYYYNPNFLSFSASPYYNQSRADSESQSITGASGVTGNANFFSGSHFPGSITYHYDHDSTGSFGLAGQPYFTTYGSSQGFGINWGASIPGWPSLAVGYSQGSGHGSIYGTDEETSSSQRMFNLFSIYQVSGFLFNGSFVRTSYQSDFPAFLTDGESTAEQSSGDNFAVGVTHRLPLNGSFSVGYTRASSSSDFISTQQNENTSTSSGYGYSAETASASFHPTPKLSLSVNENYTEDLTGALAQGLGTNGVAPAGLNLGAGSHSSTVGAGVGYTLTNYLSGSAQATYYDQYYLGNSYSGAFFSGTLFCGKRLFNALSFSLSVTDFSNGQDSNALGFAGNLNFAHRFGRWATDGQFTYAQNAQTLLVTYTTSYYQYGGGVHRRLTENTNWSAGFGGGKSGLTNDPGSSSRSESFSTSLSTQRISVNALYTQAKGISVLGPGGLVMTQPTPGLASFLIFNGSSYGGSVSVTPLQRLVIAAAYNRAISETIFTATSHNNTEVFSAQMQYHLRKIGLQAGYLHFIQGITAIGAPASTTSFYVGATRAFDVF